MSDDRRDGLGHDRNTMSMLVVEPPRPRTWVIVKPLHRGHSWNRQLSAKSKFGWLPVKQNVGTGQAAEGR
jgi:hypothetical protein